MLKNKMTQSDRRYLMAIYRLYCKTNNCRVRASDVAADLSVTRPSVTRALKRLQTLEFIVRDPKIGISLTNKGNKEAQFIKFRFDVIREFLEKSLMLAPKAAGKEAWKIENMVSNETIYKMCCFNHKYMPAFVVKNLSK